MSDVATLSKIDSLLPCLRQTIKEMGTEEVDLETALARGMPIARLCELSAFGEELKKNATTVAEREMGELVSKLRYEAELLGSQLWQRG